MPMFNAPRPKEAREWLTRVETLMDMKEMYSDFLTQNENNYNFEEFIENSKYCPRYYAMPEIKEYSALYGNVLPLEAFSVINFDDNGKQRWGVYEKKYKEDAQNILLLLDDDTLCSIKKLGDIKNDNELLNWGYKYIKQLQIIGKHGI